MISLLGNRNIRLSPVRPQSAFYVPRLPRFGFFAHRIVAAFLPISDHCLTAQWTVADNAARFHKPAS